MTEHISSAANRVLANASEAMTKQDQYHFWRRRLEGEVLPIHADDPEAGFYRTRGRNREKWEPVAYWYSKEGELRCRIGDRDIDDLTARERWPYISKHPVTHQAYLDAREGKPWPDEHEAVIGHNNAPADDSFDGLKDRIEDLAREAEKLLKVGAAKDQASADQAAHLANKLADLQKKADAARVAEKAPHLEASRAVDARWKPLADAADIYRRVKLLVITPFMNEQDRQRKIAEAAARKAAEEAAKAGAAMPAPESLTMPKPKVGSGGRRTIALRTVKRAEVVDRVAALTFFANAAPIIEALQKVADKAVRDGIEAPGVKVVETQEAA